MHGKKFGIYSGRTDKMSLVKSRSFKNSSATDTILVKLQGGIDACIRLDLIRNQPDFLTEEGESLYDYQLRDVRIWEDRLVNVLTFVPKKGIVDAVFEGELYVGVEDYAIVGAEFGYSPHMMGVVKKSLVMRKSNKIKAKPISTNYNLKYSNYEGLYYIQHIRGELNLKAKNRKQVRFSNFYTTLEMVTTSIDTLNMNTPERKDFIKTHSIFSDQVKVSPTDFWEHDNVILPEANIMNAFQQSGFVLEEKK
jgi:hypothetical protein